MTALKNILLFLFLSISTAALSQEICDNAIDDDGDGLIDLNDTAECVCYGIGDTTQTISSLIPNPSFEEMNCCPQSLSEMYCASAWEQATDATTDYLNTCGYVSSAAIQLGLVPFPDGNGAAGGYCFQGWQEYVGCCLLQPLLAGTSYTLQFNIACYMDNGCNSGSSSNYVPIEISIFGNPTCVSFPVNTSNSNYGCPPNWILLGSITYNPIASWGNIGITISPTIDISSIMIGPPCNLPPEYWNVSFACTPYIFYDNIRLNESLFFNYLNIIQSGKLCNNNLVLSGQVDTVGGSWQWYRNGIAILNQTNSYINISGNNLGQGTFSCIYTIDGQCIVSSEFEVGVNFPQADFSVISLCIGDSTNFTDESVLYPGSITDWLWDFDDGSPSSILQDPLHIFSNSGSYNVTLMVTSDEYCTSSISLPVTIHELPIINTANDTIICPGESVQLNASGGANYFWSPASGLNNIFTNNPIATPGQTTTYTVSVLDSNNCSGTASQVVTILDSVNLDYQTLWMLSCEGLEAVFTNNSTNENNFLWNFGDGTTSSDINPIHTFAYGQDYTIVLTGNTCNTTIEKTVSITALMDTLHILIPNIITPNNDALNDCFSPALSSEFSNCSEITIYNRWGNAVFKKEKGEEKCWDGKNKSDNTYLDAGTYFYILKVSDVDIKHGTVTLIRD